MVKSISTETLAHNFFPLKNVKFEFEKRDGSIEEVSREVYLSSNGAVVLLFNTENNTIILT